MKCIKIIILLFIILTPSVVYSKNTSATIIMDIDSGRILYSNNMNEKKLIASTTKIMTCIIALENLKMDKIITVGDEVREMYGTNIYLEVGEKITVKDLLYGLMLRSGNDAAITIATQGFSSYKEFIDKMNEKAKEIGMKNTIFSNPHGLDEDTKNYSTAYDMALLSQYSSHNKQYLKIIGTKKYTTKSSLKTYVWYNRVNIINQYKKSLGGKNGYTPKAGKTLVSLARENDLTLTIVTLNDNDIYNHHQKMYEEYFKEYKNYKILDKNQIKTNPYLYPKKVYLKKDFTYPLTKQELSKISTIMQLYPEINNKIAGKIIIKLDNQIIGKRLVYEKNKKKR